LKRKPGILKSKCNIGKELSMFLWSTPERHLGPAKHE
jgi:hypothetical protein